MSEAVFEDTVLGDYLSDVGAEDWGIEPSPSTPTPSQRNRGSGQTDILPLLLTENSQNLGPIRFKGLIRQALTSSLPPQEAKIFLEQFRYQIVSSNLLESRPIYASFSSTTSQRRTDLLFSADGPWSLFNVPKKYWVSGGASIVVVVAVFTLKCKRLDQSDPLFVKMSLVATLLIGLYLFSHSRRRLLRLLHAKSLGQVALFVEKAKIFDGDCVKSFKVLQQADMLGTPSARKLRSVIASCLHLMTEQFIDAIKDCLCMCSEIDLQRYFEIYDLSAQQEKLQFVMNDGYIGFLNEQSSQTFYGPESCHLPLSMLKLQFQKLHFVRRAFLCCLLTVPASGDCKLVEFERWTVITDHLKNMTDLACQLSLVVTKERFDPLYQDQPQPQQTSHLGASKKADMITMNLLSQHIAARMDLITNTALSADDYKSNIEQLDKDINALSSMWHPQEDKSSAKHSTPKSTPSDPSSSRGHARINSKFIDDIYSPTLDGGSVFSDSSTLLETPLNPLSSPNLNSRAFRKDDFMNELNSVLSKRHV